MADKDEEYHFNETEPSPSYTTEPNQLGKDRDFQGRKKSRNIILFIAALMALWSIYKFLGVFLTQPKKNPRAPVATVVTPPRTSTVSTSPVLKPHPLQTAFSTTQMQDIADQKVRLNKLESNMVNLQTTLADINTKLNDLSTQVNTFSSIQRPPSPPPVPKIRKPRPKKCVGEQCLSKSSSRSPSYRLEAAIPGRAWLLSSDGATLTVSLGDKIPGYGTVVGIDPNDGVVQISSGATIKYRSH